MVKYIAALYLSTQLSCEKVCQTHSELCSTVQLNASLICLPPHLGLLSGISLPLRSEIAMNGGYPQHQGIGGVFTEEGEVEKVISCC